MTYAGKSASFDISSFLAIFNNTDVSIPDSFSLNPFLQEFDISDILQFSAFNLGKTFPDTLSPFSLPDFGNLTSSASYFDGIIHHASEQAISEAVKIGG